MHDMKLMGTTTARLQAKSTVTQVDRHVIIVDEASRPKDVFQNMDYSDLEARILASMDAAVGSDHTFIIQRWIDEQGKVHTTVVDYETTLHNPYSISEQFALMEHKRSNEFNKLDQQYLLDIAKLKLPGQNPPEQKNTNSMRDMHAPKSRKRW